MRYFDSDVIFNSVVLQDEKKIKDANDLILNAISLNDFVISTLVIQEVGYGLARFNVESNVIRSELDYLITLNINPIEQHHLSRALYLSEIIGFKHINDCIHTAVAEILNCDSFYTYNGSDFKRIQKYTDLQIVIL